GTRSIGGVGAGGVSGVVPGARGPAGGRLSPAERMVYVSGRGDQAVAVVATGSGEVVGSIEVGWRPRDSIFTRDGKRAYVSAEHGGEIAVIDVEQNQCVEKIQLPMGALPMGLALSPDERKLYVANGRAGTVSVIDVDRSEVVANVEVGERPWGIGLTSDGKFLYTANGPSNDVSVIDTESLNVVATIRVGDTPWGIAIGSNVDPTL